MTTPTWQAPAPGQPANAGHINQFLLPHPSQIIYPGVQKAGRTTDGSAASDSNGLWVAQSFTGVTAVGRAVLTVTKHGTPGLLQVSLQNDASGKPAGVDLVSVQLPAEWFTTAKTSVSMPLPLTGLASSGTYWLVCQAVGDASDYWAIEHSTQTSGASTSPDGSTWTAQTFGIIHQLFDQTVNGAPKHEWIDGGARWSILSYDTAKGTLIGIYEYVTGQAGTYQAQGRTLAFANGNLVSVT
jgi:hypothetical protein